MFFSPFDYGLTSAGVPEVSVEIPRRSGVPEDIRKVAEVGAEVPEGLVKVAEVPEDSAKVPGAKAAVPNEPAQTRNNQDTEVP
ncbi:hypothetical protein [Ornithinibacillus halophilus]|uniref:Uncharacterized protein n=1 Tax=Ornithinibacillus halophilus TaxID=930117 RepID=A0A1M5G4W9_9BACI|nr:hypothetical protein [Ornithinibacillus halophilus]SHF98749.1 hypothetical protein SAMN05216225_101168 [Ornithinibacillus halophilus]